MPNRSRAASGRSLPMRVLVCRWRPSHVRRPWQCGCACASTPVVHVGGGCGSSRAASGPAGRSARPADDEADRELGRHAGSRLGQRAAHRPAGRPKAKQGQRGSSAPGEPEPPRPGGPRSRRRRRSAWPRRAGGRNPLAWRRPSRTATSSASDDACRRRARPGRRRVPPITRLAARPARRPGRRRSRRRSAAAAGDQHPQPAAPAASATAFESTRFWNTPPDSTQCRARAQPRSCEGLRGGRREGVVEAGRHRPDGAPSGDLGRHRRDEWARVPSSATAAACGSGAAARARAARIGAGGHRQGYWPRSAGVACGLAAPRRPGPYVTSAAEDRRARDGVEQHGRRSWWVAPRCRCAPCRRRCHAMDRRGR
jgi:hypothetical protein